MDSRPILARPLHQANDVFFPLSIFGWVWSVFNVFLVCFSSSCIFISCFLFRILWNELQVRLDTLVRLVMNSYVEWSDLSLILFWFVKIICFSGVNLFISFFYSKYFIPIFYINSVMLYLCNIVTFYFDKICFMSCLLLQFAKNSTSLILDNL